MSYFAVTYKYAAAESELAKVRPVHREYLDGLSELQLSGPLVGGAAGALLIFKADSEATVADLLDKDPFKLAGFVGERVIREWNPVLGDRLTSFTGE